MRRTITPRLIPAAAFCAAIWFLSPPLFAQTPAEKFDQNTEQFKPGNGGEPNRTDKNRPYLEVYRIASDVAEIEKTLSALLPGLVINTDKNRIHVNATESKHALVRNYLSKLDASGENSLEAIKAKYARMQQLAAKAGADDPTQLHQLVLESFRLRQDLQRLEIDRLREKLAALEQRLAARDRQQDQIVAQRVKELQRESRASGKSAKEATHRIETLMGGGGDQIPLSPEKRNMKRGSFKDLILYEPQQIQDSILSTLQAFHQSPEDDNFKRYRLAARQFDLQMAVLNSAYQQMIAEYSIERKNSDRLKKLVSRGITSQSEFDQQSLKVDQLKAQIEQISLLRQIYETAGEHEKIARVPKAPRLNVQGHVTGLIPQAFGSNRFSLDIGTKNGAMVGNPVAVILNGKQLTHGKIIQSSYRTSVISVDQPDALRSEIPELNAPNPDLFVVANMTDDFDLKAKRPTTITGSVTAIQVSNGRVEFHFTVGTDDGVAPDDKASIRLDGKPFMETTTQTVSANKSVAVSTLSRENSKTLTELLRTSPSGTNGLVSRFEVRFMSSNEKENGSASEVKETADKDNTIKSESK